LTGQNKTDSRAGIWNEKRVFFVTPQVINNDLQSGICPANSIVCLVIDEAHRFESFIYFILLFISPRIRK